MNSMLPPGHPLDFFLKQPETKGIQKYLVIIKIQDFTFV